MENPCAILPYMAGDGVCVCVCMVKLGGQKNLPTPGSKFFPRTPLLSCCFVLAWIMEKSQLQHLLTLIIKLGVITGLCSPRTV